jgi:hypothetical protein
LPAGGGNWDESCDDDLAAAGLEALGAEVCLEHLEELFNHSRFTQSLPKEGDCSCIRNAVHHTKTNKLLEGTPIIHLEFKLFIANIKKLLEYKHLEKDQRINPLAPCVALPLECVALIKERSK